MDGPDLTLQPTDEAVFRVQFPQGDVRAELVRSGVSPEALDDTLAALRAKGEPTNLEEAVRRHFSPYPSASRFSDGSVGVLYTALEQETSVREVQHHLTPHMLDDEQPRIRWMIACRFAGNFANLVGQQEAFPELVSADESGYPFCQATARAAIELGADGLHAPSARNASGTCVPIFSSLSVAHIERRHVVRYEFVSGAVVARAVQD